MITCPNCGATNPSAATFCNLCMTPFAPTTDTAPVGYAGGPPGLAPPPAPVGYAGGPPGLAPPPAPVGYAGGPPGLAPPPGPPAYGGGPPAYGGGPPAYGGGPPGYGGGPPGAYSQTSTQQRPGGTEKIEPWKLGLLIGIPVLLVVVAIGAFLLKAPPGGTAEMPKLDMKFQYPDGWRNDTNNDSKKKDAGFSDAEIRKLPQGSLDVLLTGGKERTLLIFSAIPDSSVKFDELANDFQSTASLKVIDKPTRFSLLGGNAVRMTGEATGSGSLFGLPETYQFYIILFERQGRLAFVIGGSEKAKFTTVSAELNQMIESMEPMSF